MQRHALALFTIGLMASVIPHVRAAPATVQVHEWGTFTSLQNEAGETIGGINTDDEPLPPFVHRISDTLLIKPNRSPFAGANDKGLGASCHPEVTMRLETPVLYFHLPQGDSPLRGVTVQARFRGGWLSEFYPDADAEAPGLTQTGIGHLHADTVGTLTWKDLEVGTEGKAPATRAHVWIAPRAVDAQPVRTAGGESEKFLFYRGVAHIDAPLVALQDARAGQLILRSRLPRALADRAPLAVESAWLVDIRTDGAAAFAPLPSLTLGSTASVAATVSMRFAPEDYHADGSAQLRASLLQALVAQGLFDDEARALLATWELSYFKSPGMRVFFLVPRAWTDFYLPLQVSVSSQITRVMVGRIELVTPDERRNLEAIGQLSAQDVTTEAEHLRKDLLTNPKRLAELSEVSSQLPASVEMPAAYRRYLALGRFRNALVLDEAARHPTPAIKALLNAYGLDAYQPPDAPRTPAEASRR